MSWFWHLTNCHGNTKVEHVKATWGVGWVWLNDRSLVSIATAETRDLHWIAALRLENNLFVVVPDLVFGLLQLSHLSVRRISLSPTAVADLPVSCTAIA
jgi:hypothetical protein